MGRKRPAGPEEFGAAFTELLVASDLTPDKIVRLLPGEVSRSALYDWKKGHHLPADVDLLTAVVKVCIAAAERRGAVDRGRGGTDYWLKLLADAKQSRDSLVNQARRAGPLTSSAPAPPTSAFIADQRAEDRQRAYVTGYRYAAARLRDRDDELAQMAAFATAVDGPAVLTWVAGPWAGKTALLAHFALHPPPGVQVVAYFVDSNMGDRNSCNTCVSSLVKHLTAIAGGQAVGQTEDDPLEVLPHVLERATTQLTEHDQRLVLVIDGLDEDAHTDEYSIAAVLSKLDLRGVRLIVSTRPNPMSMDAAALLTKGVRRALADWPDAGPQRDRAQREIERALADRDQLWPARLGMIALARGLTVEELAELTGEKTYHLRQALNGHLARTLKPITDEAGEQIWCLAHPTTNVAVHETLANELPAYRRAIHQWAATYRQAGWPAHTPRFLLEHYPAMLARTVNSDPHALAILASLAGEQTRHDMMNRRTRSDSLAIKEITTVWLRLTTAPEPDWTLLLCCSLERDRLTHRSHHMPDRLPAVWARLGDLRHADALLHALSDTRHRASALLDMAVAVASVNPGQAERLAKDIDDPSYLRVEALAEVAVAIAGSDPDRATTLLAEADQIARSTNTYSPFAGPHPTQLLAKVVAAMASIDPDRAEDLARNIDSSQPIADGWGRRRSSVPEMLATLAGAIAERDPDRATSLLTEAEQLADDTNPTPMWAASRAKALASVAAAVASSAPDQAEQIARSIPQFFASDRVEALAKVAAVMLPTHPDQAETLLTEAERDALHEHAHHWGSSRVLETFLAAVAGVAPDRAEQIARSVPRRPDSSEAAHASVEASALLEIALAVADSDPKRAKLLAAEAERIAHPVDDPTWRHHMMASVAVAMAAIDPAQAEQIARRIDDPDRTAGRRGPSAQAHALTEVAVAAAIIEPARAEQIARRIEDSDHTAPSSRARALAKVGVAVAGNDPDRAMSLLAEAEQIAPGFCGEDLMEVAAMMADNNPVRAEQIVRSDRRPHWHLTPSTLSRHVKVLAKVAATMAGTEPDRAKLLLAEAKQIALSPENRNDQDTVPLPCREALAEVAASMAGIDPAEAEQIARSIDDPYVPPWIWDSSPRVEALAKIAAAVTRTDPNRAAQLLTQIEQITRRTYATFPNTPHDRGMALAKVAVIVAGIDPERAAQIARSIDDPSFRPEALAKIATAVAANDPTRATSLLTETEQSARNSGDSPFQGEYLQTVAEEAMKTGLGDPQRLVISVLGTRNWRSMLPIVAKLCPSAVLNLAATLGLQD